MKNTLTKLITEEKGQALVIALILLGLGGLLIAPLMAFMSTGLDVGQVHEERTAELYAADAGIEDALLQLKMNPAELPKTKDEDPWQYPIADVNAKDVDVEIVAAEDTVDFLTGLLGIKPKPPMPHPTWMVVGAIIAPGTYEIEIKYQGSAANKKIYNVGAWMYGTYTTYPQEDGWVTGITDEYSNYSFTEKEYKGGTAFIWEWTAAARPSFAKDETKYLTFKFTPPAESALSLAWVKGGSDDIWLSYLGEWLIWKITSTATDSPTGKKTQLTAYVSRINKGTEENPFYTTLVLAWEIDQL